MGDLTDEQRVARFLADVSTAIRGYLTDDTDVTRPSLHATALTHRLAPLLADRDAGTLERAARAIETRRNEHWQRHLRDHPLSNATSCPGDYAAHDAYRGAAKIVRAQEVRRG